MNLPNSSNIIIPQCPSFFEYVSNFLTKSMTSFCSNFSEINFSLYRVSSFKNTLSVLFLVSDSSKFSKDVANLTLLDSFDPENNNFKYPLLLET